jgi:5-oxoprolinase (ATP-hydrolysing) subunit A
VRFIDLSCDLGEASTADEDLVESRLWPLITSANVACGGHTGDISSMRRAVERAHTHSVALGAHPSYPDRVHFGRKRMSISTPALVDSLVEQISALATVAREMGLSVAHVKPHGALYNDAHHDRPLAESIVAAVTRFDRRVAIVCSRSSAVFAASTQAGVPTITEAFADRRYRPDGSLVPRRETDALILDPREAATQALSLALVASTICIHSDMARSVERLEAIREVLSTAGFGFRSCASGHE